jgi:hypothetical protein
MLIPEHGIGCRHLFHRVTYCFPNLKASGLLGMGTIPKLRYGSVKSNSYYLKTNDGW